ncbi:MAG TPA: T9SS type A sorting domain-containing protein, partial [Ignavibacteriaceae bacterium]|nr:T9SS type A sorting domain-containing protein [Ignavibacteriaceae bacterium]
YQNYPNPFNPSTRISYYIPQSGKVCINVYNLLAQQIAVPVNEIQEAGRHDIVFNAYKLPAGLYFYQVQSGSFSETRKMLLLK